MAIDTEQRGEAGERPWDVVVEMKVIKTYRVWACDEGEAIEHAHRQATPRYEDGVPEDYDENTVDVHVVSDEALRLQQEGE